LFGLIFAIITPGIIMAMAQLVSPISLQSVYENDDDFCYDWKNNLKRGMRKNKDVKALQTALRIEGIYRGPITSMFGMITFRAVKQFQQDNNLKPSGLVNQETRDLLNDLYGCGDDSIDKSTPTSTNGSANKLPDLIVSEITASPSRVVINQPTTMTFVIKNIGTASAKQVNWEPDYGENAYAGDNYFNNSCANTSLQPGHSCKVTREIFYSTPGHKIIRIYVGDGSFAELDKNNNSRTFNEVTVLPNSTVSSIIVPRIDSITPTPITISIPIAFDNEVNSLKSSEVISKSPYINIGYSSAYGSEQMYYLGKIDLSGFDKTRNIQKAMLRIDRASNSRDNTRDYVIYPLKSEFNPSTVTWKNQPSIITDGHITGTLEKFGVFTFDITNMAKGWISGSIPNYGLMITKNEGAGDGYGLFASIDYPSGGAETKPSLEITYTEK
jgi:hypothetical protein